MAWFRKGLITVVIFTLVANNEAATPFFLQAIASALGTIPFTAGPMTTGLVGAKLAVGSKLLYYLGFFGRRRSKSKSAQIPTSHVASGFGSGFQFPAGMQTVPLPYSFGGGFPQQFGGFSQPGFMGQHPYGYDPAQLFQILAAQGIDPVTAMQAMSFNGGIGSQAVPASKFPFPTGATQKPNVVTGQGKFPSESPITQSNEKSDEDETDDEVESFFAFLRDMDDNTCISRLMCDIGANPSFLAEFSENIHSIISSLDVLPSSGAFQYISIMETGRREGGCGQRFTQCSDAAYEIVKNVAPSVGVPPNINSNVINTFN